MKIPYFTSIVTTIRDVRVTDVPDVRIRPEMDLRIRPDRVMIEWTSEDGGPDYVRSVKIEGRLIRSGRHNVMEERNHRLWEIKPDEDPAEILTDAPWALVVIKMVQP